jgi:hypothetical protein
MKSPICRLILALSLCAIVSTAARAAELASAQALFFENLRKLCGSTFEGATEFPEDPNHPLGGKKLTIHIASCSETEIRIPLQAGEDKSRTWVLTLRDGRLLLKHDHRHADGTPDVQTNYGGWATSEGSPERQRFAADEETAKLIPESATNVWTIEFDAAGEQFVYSLERHAAPRYKAVFRRTKPAH